MGRVQTRIPEGGAIEDTPDMTTEEYSKIMKQRLGGEYRRFVRHIMQSVKPPEGAKVLEIGPGPGWGGIWLLCERTDLRLDGLEASVDMIRAATKNAETEGVSERIRYLRGIVEQMTEISDNSYDLVISRDSLHHWEEPQQGFREISRVVKPEGRVYIQDMRRDLGFFAKCLVNILGPLFAGRMLKYWKTSIAASYTPEELRKMLSTLQLGHWTVRSNVLELSVEASTL